MIDNTVESSLFVRDQPLPTNNNIPANVLRSIYLIFIKIILDYTTIEIMSLRTRKILDAHEH